MLTTAASGSDLRLLRLSRKLCCLEVQTTKHLVVIMVAIGRNRGPTWTIAGNIALRWSTVRPHTGCYKHSAPLEPERYLVGAWAALQNLRNPWILHLPFNHAARRAFASAEAFGFSSIR
jgi:hypothetical protein